MRPRAIVAGTVIVLIAALVGLVGSAALFGGDGGAARAPGPRLAGLPGAVGGSTRFSADAAQASVPKRTSVIATAPGARIRVYAQADGTQGRTLRRRNVEGHPVPLTFLVRSRRAGWVQAYLPTRPNLSTGWLRTRDIRLATTPYRVQVQLRSHQLTLRKAAGIVLRAPIAKGRAVSPTPTGRYYVTDLIRPTDPKSFYGPYALGLSAHSPVYTSFAGGDGQVGLHGTNDPAALGSDVSHGCIRVANRVITRLAKLLPLGTPVEITRG
jgi:lipoprotein-anchoring transpeptidase ErfK/SrfK